MINATDLAAMQSQMSDTRDGTLIIKRRTMTTDGEGGFTPTWAAVTGGTVEYRIVQMTGLERAFAGRFGTVGVWRIGLPLTPEVLPSDVLYSGTVPMYQVTAGNLPRTIPLEQLVECVRL
jgi:hypothetical protein